MKLVKQSKESARKKNPTSTYTLKDRTWGRGMGRISILDRNEEMRLAEIIQKNGNNRIGIRAQNKLVESNLRFVMAFVKNSIPPRQKAKAKRLGIDFNDLLQEGAIGLMNAAAPGKYNGKYRFNTYAAWYIRAAITKALNQSSGVKNIELSIRNLSMALKICRTGDKSILGTIRGIKIKEKILKVAEKCRKDREYLRGREKRLEVLFGRLMAMDEVVYMSGLGTHEDGEQMEMQIAGDDENSILEKVMRVDDEVYESMIGPVIEKFSFRERKIIRERLMAQDDNRKTLQELGYELEITRERVRQIEVIIKAKLREEEGIKDAATFMGISEQQGGSRSKNTKKKETAFKKVALGGETFKVPLYGTKINWNEMSSEEKVRYAAAYCRENNCLPYQLLPMIRMHLSKKEQEHIKSCLSKNQ